MSLPENWEKRFTKDGKVYYANLLTKTTHWELPKDFLTNNNSSQSDWSKPILSARNKQQSDNSISNDYRNQVKEQNKQTINVTKSQTIISPRTNENSQTSNYEYLKTSQTSAENIQNISLPHREAPPPPYPSNSSNSFNLEKEPNISSIKNYNPPQLQKEISLSEIAPDCSSLSQLLQLAEDQEVISTKKPKFSLQSPTCLEIQVTSRVFVRRGSMVAFRGDLKFERGSKSKNLGMKLLKIATGAGPSMMKVMGVGRIFVADYCKRVQILRLNNETLVVNGSDILAFEESLQWTMKVMESPSSMIQGGIFSIEIKGTGIVCVTTHGHPLLLKAGPYHPLRTDPNSTVCWSGNLTPVLKTDITMKSFIGRGSGEEFQMEFRGSQVGFVMVQPYEEVMKI